MKWSDLTKALAFTLIITLFTAMSVHQAFAATTSVTGTLREGESQVYNLNGRDYTVTLVFVTDPGTTNAEAKFSVDGELTAALGIGESDALSCSQITVNSILATAREGTVSFTLARTGVEGQCSAVPPQPTPNPTPTPTGGESISGTLAVGEAHQYTLGNAYYEISLVFVSEPGTSAAQEAKFSVNGELTRALEIGDSDLLTCGEVAVKDIQTVQGKKTVTYELKSTATCNVPVPSSTLIAEDKLPEGGSKRYNSIGREYDVTLVFVSDPGTGATRAKFSVNGELTSAMPKGGYGEFSCGSIKVTDITNNAREGTASFKLYAINDCVIAPSRPRITTFPQPYFIVSAQGASTAEMLEILEFQKVFQASVPEQKPALRDDIAFATSELDDLGKSLSIVMGNRHALILLGESATDEQRGIAKSAEQALTTRGFTFATITGNAQNRRYLIVEAMLGYFENGNIPVDTSRVCPQVDTPAARSDGRCRVFATPCEVPQSGGWVAVESCENPVALPPSQQPTVVTATAEPPAPTPEESCTSGCLKGDQCIPVGTRLANGNAVYCGIDGMQTQVSDSEACQNNYECKSNQCYNAVCVSVEKDVQETKGLMQRIADWFKGMFG